MFQSFKFKPAFKLNDIDLPLLQREKHTLAGGASPLVHKPRYPLSFLGLWEGEIALQGSKGKKVPSELWEGGKELDKDKTPWAPLLNVALEVLVGTLA